MWAVRDLELGAVTTARRLPQLLGCTARFVTEPPAGVGPGDVADVTVTFPDGTEITSDDRERLDARLTELVGKRVALVPLPPMSDKAGYRGVLASKRDIRSQWALTDDEPLPDFSMFPIREASPAVDLRHTDRDLRRCVRRARPDHVKPADDGRHRRGLRPTPVPTQHRRRHRRRGPWSSRQWVGGTLRAGRHGTECRDPGRTVLGADARAAWPGCGPRGLSHRRTTWRSLLRRLHRHRSKRAQ